ncbi:hypothetical protein BOX15_Mlig012214g3 [Macrostomum lignano]|uniref:Ras-related protein Rab-36 n=2 Tax=Macrostomum lignano TaxID=282301 RepID=A0A267EEP7_9PLAT|nr:hypothetical protein BOX15_Mlig012214g3 [Macrostomum lignano]
MQVDQNLLVESDRIISSYPLPQLAEFTPYKDADFHPVVKSTCATRRGSTTSFKTCKCVVVGEVAVGKTSLVNRFCHKTFQRDYKATIGVDFEVEKLAVLGVPFRLQIWDTAGQERFRSIGSAYYRGAHAVIAAFDLSDLATLDRAVQWTQDACQTAGGESVSATSGACPVKFLVGTKRDSIGDTKYRTAVAAASAVAARLGSEFWPTSALTGEGVVELFHRAAALAFQVAVLRDSGEGGAAACANSDGGGQKVASAIQLGPSPAGQPARKSSVNCCN